MSKGHINRLMEIWSANMQEGTSPFSNCKHLQTRIDSIEVGDVPWKSFSCKYRGTVMEESPTWMKQEYEVHCRDPLEVVKNILANTEFDESLDYAPYKEYGTDGQRQFHDLMSANWAYDEAVSFRSPSLFPRYR